MEATTLSSNQFWGRRSGTIHPVEGPIIRLRRAGAYVGRTGKKKPQLGDPRWPAINVPKKWFIKNYRSKRG